MREIVLQLLMWVVTVCDYIAYVPQLRKLVKTKKSEDISVGSWLLWMISSICDTSYAILLGRYELIVSASSCLLLNSLVLVLTLHYNKVNNRKSDILTETDEEFEARIKKIMAKDGNHMVLITAMIDERNKAKSSGKIE